MVQRARLNARLAERLTHRIGLERGDENDEHRRLTGDSVGDAEEDGVVEALDQFEANDLAVYARDRVEVACAERDPTEPFDRALHQPGSMSVYISRTFFSGSRKNTFRRPYPSP